MKNIFCILIVIAGINVAAVCQKPSATPAKVPAGVPVKPGTSLRSSAAAAKPDAGTVSGRTYTSTQFGFDVQFPDTWLIPGPDFEDYMRQQGFDLHVVDTAALGPANAARFKKQVTILLTAYRSMPGTEDNATAIIAVENLALNPQIKDAVDYIDAVRAPLVKAKLPSGMTVSETEAEQLGAMQFAYLDTANGKQKRRMYATVRKGYAIMFTLAYTDNDDLTTFRRVLEEGNFALNADAATKTN